MDPNQIIIQFSSKPITYSECEYHQYSTTIKKDPKIFSEGNLVSVKGNNKDFDHNIPLICKFGGNGKKEMIILSTQIRYEHVDVQNGAHAKLSSIETSIKNSQREYQKAGLEGVKKIHIFNTLRQTKQIGLKKEDVEDHSISFLEDKELPMDSYIVTDNVAAFGSTFSFNNIAHFLDDKL